jgi:hypothetical protein
MEISNVSGQATARSNSLAQLLRRHPLFFFFLMAYGFSWLVEIPLVLLHLPSQLIVLLGPSSARPWLPSL